MSWPPTEERLSAVASDVMASDVFVSSPPNSIVTCLCYLDGWGGQLLFIFEPIHFGDTKYISRLYSEKGDGGRKLKLIVGKED